MKSFKTVQNNITLKLPFSLFPQYHFNTGEGVIGCPLCLFDNFFHTFYLFLYNFIEIYRLCF